MGLPLVCKWSVFRFLDVKVSSLDSIARKDTLPSDQNIWLKSSVDREKVVYPDFFRVCVWVREESSLSLSSIWRFGGEGGFRFWVGQSLTES